MPTGDITKHTKKKKKRNIYICGQIQDYNLKDRLCTFPITALNEFDLKQQNFPFYY